MGARYAKTAGMSASRRLVSIILAVVVIVAMLLAYVWSHISITRFQYEIARELSRKNRLEETIKKLKVEVATLKTPQRIEEKARTELNMGYPTRDQVVFVQ